MPGCDFLSLWMELQLFRPEVVSPDSDWPKMKDVSPDY